VTGHTRRHGVAEVIMGTPLRDVIRGIGGGARPGRRIKAVLPGVSTGILPEELLDAPVSYEGLAAIDSGLGSGSFIVFDDTVDMVAVAAGVSRFLGVESCGQCTPCKFGGLHLAEDLRRVSLSEAPRDALVPIEVRTGTVNEQARCYLAHQHRAVLQSLLQRFPEEFRAHVAGEAPPVEPYLIAELVDIVDGEALWDERFRDKQGDWSYDPLTKGKVPADRFGKNRFGDWTVRPELLL
jgi:NADH-quinone oxidoreductase subunit F